MWGIDMSEPARVHDIDALAHDNPRADIDQVRKVGVLMEELRRTGVESPGYMIESPYERRCFVAPEP